MERINLMTNRKLAAVGAYIYAGGFTVGVKQAGFDVLAHLEGADGYGTKVVERNFPNLPIYRGESEWEDFLDKLDRPIDMVYGNPPCAAWSNANPKSHKPGSWEKDARVICTEQHFTLLLRLQPKIWIWESVTQVLKKGKPFVDSLTRKALDAGYSVSYILHDAQYLGVPQTRKRWFMVCHNREFRPAVSDWAVTTAGKALNGVAAGNRLACTRKHIAKLGPMLRKLTPGKRLSKFWEDTIAPDRTKWSYKSNGAVIGRPAFGHTRLRSDLPATATVGYAMVHPVEHRFLSLREVQILAGFPEDYDFNVTNSRWCAPELVLIARGVCPPVGKWIARAARKAIKEDKKVKTPVVTLYDYRKPGIEPVDLTMEYI